MPVEQVPPSLVARTLRPVAARVQQTLGRNKCGATAQVPRTLSTLIAIRSRGCPAPSGMATKAVLSHTPRPPLWHNHHTRMKSLADAVSGHIRPRLRPDCRSDWGWLGARVEDATCLPSAVPEYRASIVKQTVFVWTRCGSRPRPFGTASVCLSSLWRRLCSRPAPSRPPSEIPSLPVPADRRRCNIIARHHPLLTDGSHP